MIAYTHYASDPRVIREAEAAVSGGFDVDFLALRRRGDPPVETIRGVRVLHVAQYRYRGAGHARYLAAYLQFFVRCFVRCATLYWSRRYVAIHVNNMPDFLVFSTLVPRLLGAKVILDIHDSMPNTFAAKFKSGDRHLIYRLLVWEERLSAAYCNQVITVHHPLRDGILAPHGLAPASVEVIANFADERLFRRREVYAVEDVIRLVFHGTILERSGLRLLVNALARVQRKDLIRCRIIGEGDFSAELRELIDSFGLTSVVEFDNKCYPVSEIPARLADCHVGIIPLELSSATNYALPLKLVEYIAMGLPVVSIRSAAITYYLKESDCLFYQWDDPASLAAVLDGLAENPGRLLEYRERSLSIRERFLWSREKQKYVDLLRRLTGTAPETERGPENGMVPLLEQSIARVTQWVEARQYRAYDPGDGNLSYLRAWTFENLFLQRLLTAGVLRMPVNLRPLLGIRPHRSTKGTGYMAWGYLKMFALTQDDAYRRRAIGCFDWLMQNRSPGFAEYCWGNHFDFCTRGGRSRALSPIMPWTALIGQAFLEAHRTLGDEMYLDVATGVRDWILAVPREMTRAGTCLSYVPDRQSSIHNANMLAAGFLGQFGALTGDREALAVAHEAMYYSCARQNPDGSWPYAAAAKYQWNDNFHTGYNLDALKRYQDSTGDRSFEAELSRGFQFFKQHFFEADGAPKYYHDRVYPIDSQCAGQAIDTLSFFADRDADALPLAQKVAAWTIAHMQDQDGHFYYRDLGWKKIKTPMLHWAQGTIFKGMAHLLSRLKSPESEALPAASTGVMVGGALTR